VTANTREFASCSKDILGPPFHGRLSEPLVSAVGEQPLCLGSVKCRSRVPDFGIGLKTFFRARSDPPAIDDFFVLGSEALDSLSCARRGGGAQFIFDAVRGPMFEPALQALGHRVRQVEITSVGDRRVSFDLAMIPLSDGCDAYQRLAHGELHVAAGLKHEE
jgi:hypothetical protein